MNNSAPNTSSVGVQPQDKQTKYLNPEATATQKYLVDVLLAPSDKPLFHGVVAMTRKAIETYGKTLTSPSPAFTLIRYSVDQLSEQLNGNTITAINACELEYPLYRRLLPHPGYALCITLLQASQADLSLELEATGLAIAYALATNQQVDAAFANGIRRAVAPKLFDRSGNDDQCQTKWQATYLKKRTQAAHLFESGGTPDPESTNCARLFDVHARFELTRKFRYSPPRQRQAVLDRRHQSVVQLKQSSKSLFARAIAGDQTALLIILSFSTGLSLRTTIDIPLALHVNDGNWTMLLDIDAGVLKTNIATLTPNSASPKPGSTCFRPANKIAVKPLPLDIANLLRAMHQKCPDARTLAELLLEADCTSGQLTLDDDTSSLYPSVTRFLTSAGPFSVSLGIDRLSAAIIVNDYSLIPGSKLYYCQVQRDDIWQASAQLYRMLGWHEPTPLCPGLPCGSLIVPTRQALCEWYVWMIDSISKVHPGPNSSTERLLAHHNVYSRFCASLSILCLAAREVKALRFTTHNLLPDAEFASFNDKWVGAFPGQTKVPVNGLLRKQLRYWYAHCAALHRRLKKNPAPENGNLISALERFLAGVSVPLFFEVDGKREFKPLGTSTLTAWWPDRLRFSGDFGRHLWETELRNAGVWSSRIDLLLRHITRGVESQCSSNGDPLALSAAAITVAQEQLLKELGIQPLPGLSTK